MAGAARRFAINFRRLNRIYKYRIKGRIIVNNGLPIVIGCLHVITSLLLYERMV
ncbi:hypothetical protein JCM19037_2909 [Geomicrobium sp. JCM 19037]|nr:hypothetical protein JCM19037_2909 [Geomicrobium sp. JCM 19037]